MKQIQEWLGHSDISTTANIYAHLDAQSKNSALKRWKKLSLCRRNPPLSTDGETRYKVLLRSRVKSFILLFYLELPS